MISVIGRNKCETKAGFSMVELMITVAIISVCLMIGLRVFLISARAVSEAYNTTLALNILQDKMDELQEKTILEGGLEVSSFSEDVISDNRAFSFAQEIVEWEPEEEEGGEEVLAPEEGAVEIVNLCEAELGAEWKTGNKPRRLAVKTIIPAKDFWYEF